jgi:hypothetical protein
MPAYHESTNSTQHPAEDNQAHSFGSLPFDEPPLELTEPPPDWEEEWFESSANTRVEWDFTPADAKTVETRKRSSAFAASFNAVFRRSGIPEACRKLDLDLNEIKAIFLTGIDGAQRAEYFAERDGNPCAQERRFQASAATMEIFHKRLDVPRGMDEGERAKWMKARGRNWQRHFKSVTLAQRFIHLPLFIREKGAASSVKRVSPFYVDRLTDLVADTARRARGKSGEPVGRYNRAADAALAHFREVVAPYAPEWSLEAHRRESSAKDASAKSKTVKPVEPAQRATLAAAKLVKAGKRIARESGMSAEEELAFRLVMHSTIDNLWANSAAAETTKATHDAAYASLVLTNSDTHEKDDAAPVEKGSDLTPANTPETQNYSVKVQNPPENTPHFVVDLGGVSFAEADAAAEAHASVGVESVKVVFVGETKPLGKNCAFSEKVSLSDFRRNLPTYLERNARAPVESMTVRFRFKGDTRFLPIDDCTPAVMRELAPFSFLQFETSPGNGQTLLAFAESLDLAAFEVLRKRILGGSIKATGANGGAHGSIRWPGSLNRKPKRKFADGTSPRVKIISVAPGRKVTIQELEEAGLLAAPVEKVKKPLIVPATRTLPAGAMPDYERYLTTANGDRSRADIRWAMACLGAGFPHHSVVAQLESISGKAQGRHDGYAATTVDNAVRYVVEHHAREVAA